MSAPPAAGPVPGAPRRSRAATAVTAAAVVVALAAAALDALEIVAVAGDSLIPMWSVALAAALVAVLATGAGSLLARRRLDRAARGRRRAGVLAWVAVVGTAVVAIAASLTGFNAATSASTVLPSSPDAGCRLAAVESSVFLRGRAALYAFADGETALLEPRASVRFDGGGAPVASGFVDVTWVAGATAEIEIAGALEGVRTVTCP